MAAPVGFTASLALRASALLALSGALAACGSGSPAGDSSAARAAREAAETAPQPAAACGGRVTGVNVSVIARCITSVWSDEGIVAETNGIAASTTVLRAGGHTIAGSLPLPPGELPAKGTLRAGGVTYRYTSMLAQRYPSGSVRIYLFRPARAVRALCGRTARDTLVRTLESVARAIYA